MGITENIFSIIIWINWNDKLTNCPLPLSKRRTAGFGEYKTVNAMTSVSSDWKQKPPENVTSLVLAAFDKKSSIFKSNTATVSVMSALSEASSELQLKAAQPREERDFLCRFMLKVHVV